MLMRHDKCSVKTELLMQNSYNLPMRGIFWCSYLGEEIYSSTLNTSGAEGVHFVDKCK